MLTPAQLIVDQAFRYMLEQWYTPEGLAALTVRNDTSNETCVEWLAQIAAGTARLSYNDEDRANVCPCLTGP